MQVEEGTGYTLVRRTCLCADVVARGKELSKARKEAARNTLGIIAVQDLIAGQWREAQLKQQLSIPTYPVLTYLVGRQVSRYWKPLTKAAVEVGEAEPLQYVHTGPRIHKCVMVWMFLLLANGSSAAPMVPSPKDINRG